MADATLECDALADSRSLATEWHLMLIQWKRSSVAVFVVIITA